MGLSPPEFDNGRLLPASPDAPADPAKTASMTPAMALAMASNFSSAAHWRAALLAHAQALRGEVGWVALMFQPQDGRLATRGSTDAQANAPVALPEMRPEMLPRLGLTAPGPGASPGA